MRHRSERRAGSIRSRTSGGCAQCLGGLAQVVLQQLGLRERTTDLDLLFARQTGTLERPGQQCRRISAPPLGKGLNRLRVQVRAYPRR